MVLTAVDPALLVYRARDWQDRTSGCYLRLARLLLHRRFVRDFQQSFAMSSRLSAAIMQHFPWQVDTRVVAELRDLRLVILEDLSRLTMIDDGEECEAELGAEAGTCAEVEDRDVRDAWEKLLAGCASVATGAGERLRIATWDPVPREPPPSETMLTVLCDPIGEPNAHSVRLVWDEESWHADLALEDWWPNLGRCVLLLIATSPSLRASATLQTPLEFSATRRFHKNLGQYCQQPGLQRSLVESIAKLTHGVLDKGLGDEAFRGMRRFRVSDFWRVHYRIESGVVVLLEFGPHDVGLG